MHSNLPIPNSYWVEPGRLLAGEHPGGMEEQDTRSRLVAFLSLGIDDFKDLTQEQELPSYNNILQQQALERGLSIVYDRFAIPDFGIPSIPEMASILAAIDRSLLSGKRVYVHCWGGVGRTGTVIGCYLVNHGHTPEQALNQIAVWWQSVPKRAYHPRSPETQAQFDFIRDWKAIR